MSIYLNDNIVEAEAQPSIAPRFAGAGAELEITPRQRISVKVFSEDTQGACSIVEILAEPGEGVPPHVHEREDETFHILSGTAAVMVAGETRVVQAGDYGFLPRGIVHAWEAIGETPLRFTVTITPGGMEQMFLEMHELIREFGGEEIVMSELVAEWMPILERYRIGFGQ
jgi:quercetin dioxygenase-like cupin family protein